MLNIVLLVLALVPLVRPDCGVGEVFTTCGTACEDTCDNYLDESRVCTLQCVTGCFCEGGKVRSEPDNRCVDTSECPVCGANQVFTTCGTACEDTCDNYLDESRVCTMNCVTGCFCEGGKVRSEPDNRCVDTSECPVCGANQEYGCGSVCPDTCDNYDAPRACIEICRIGCLCSQGYVLANDDSTECVHTSDCPGREGCGINEHYRICGSACPTTCFTREHEVACTMQCVTGCFCNDGFLLHEGECVSDTKCNQVLGIRQGDGAAVYENGHSHEHGHDHDLEHHHHADHTHPTESGDDNDDGHGSNRGKGHNHGSGGFHTRPDRIDGGDRPTRPGRTDGGDRPSRKPRPGREGRTRRAHWKN